MKKLFNLISLHRKSLFALVVAAFLIVNAMSSASPTLSATFTEDGKQPVLQQGDGQSQYFKYILPDGQELNIDACDPKVEACICPDGGEFCYTQCDPKKDQHCVCDPSLDYCADPGTPDTCDPKNEDCVDTGPACDPKSDKNCICYAHEDDGSGDYESCVVDECNPQIDYAQGCQDNGYDGGYYPATDGSGTDGDTDDGDDDDGSGDDDDDGGGPTGPPADVEICGFAWGGTSEPVSPKMGAGWISFNSRDCDVNGDGTISSSEAPPNGCPIGSTANYGVKVSTGTKDLYGYAWSSNLGWLKFDGLSGFPTSGGNSPQNARINGDGSLSGWARFCAGTATGNCGTNEGRSDGWDGWVSLRGTSPTYGVTVAGNNFAGNSWGDEVGGWINWNAGTGSSVRYCAGAPVQGLVVTLAANPTSGPVVLHSRLTANYQLTSADQKMLAQGGGTPSYRFKCDYSSEWSAPQISNIYDCDYPTPNTRYFPRAQVTIGTLVSEGATEVQTDAATSGGVLHAACTVSRPAFVGSPVTWTVTIDSPSTPPYDYNFVFSDGQGDTTRLDSSNTSEQVINTYTSPGSRTLTATVTDSAAIPVTVQCDRSANVIVKPTIIPI